MLVKGHGGPCGPAWTLQPLEPGSLKAFKGAMDDQVVVEEQQNEELETTTHQEQVTTGETLWGSLLEYGFFTSRGQRLLLVNRIVKVTHCQIRVV